MIIAWLDRDNTIDIMLSDNGVPIDHSLITRILLVFNALTIDSVTSASLFDLTGQDKIVFKPGASTTLVPGSFNMRIVTYDQLNTDGVVWGDEHILIMQG